MAAWLLLSINVRPAVEGIPAAIRAGPMKEMKRMKITVLIAGLSLGLTPVASGLASAQTVQIAPKYVTIDGEVVRYEPGRTIVIRGVDKKEVLYTLSPTLTMPADVRVGRRVTLFTEPGEDGGTQLVSRVTITSVTPEGSVKKVTEDTRNLPSGATTRTTTTTISGRVEAYEPGKTLTITRADGSQATYIITGTSMVPSDLVIGKSISIVPTASGELVVKTITYTPIKPQR